MCAVLGPLLACTTRSVAPGPLDSIAALNRLSGHELREGRPVAFVGVVTLYDPGLQLLVVQDATGGVPIALPARMDGVQEGDQVSVEGFSGYEGFSPLVVKATLERIGPGQVPRSGAAGADGLFGGAWDYQLITTECRVMRLVGSQTGHFTVGAEIAGRQVDITGSGAQTSGVRRFIGRRVRVEGIPITTYAPSGVPYSLRIYTGRTHGMEPIQGTAAIGRSLTTTRGSQARRSGTPLPTLSRIMEVKSLPSAEAARGYPATLRGVVTNWDVEHVNFFLQDETAAVYVLPDERPRQPPAPGDLVEIQGVTGRGGFAPVVYGRSVHVLGRRRLPAPRKVDLSKTISSLDENAWAELEGIVLSTRQASLQATELRLRHGPTALRATLQMPLGPDERRALVNTRVRLLGTLSPLFASDGHLTGVNLLVPSRDDLEVLGSMTGDTFASPARPIRAVLGYSPDVDRPSRVKVEGHVVYAGFGGGAYVMDETGGLRLLGLSGGSVRVGDTIAALGFLEPIGPRAHLAWTEVRTLPRRDPPPRPRAVAAADLRTGLFEGQLVEVEGFLQARRLAYGDRIFELDAGPVTFAAILAQPQSFPQWAHLREGALLRLTGVSQVEWDLDESPPTSVSLRVLLRSPDDIVLLRSAPWWTLRRALTLAATLLGVLFLASAWVWTLQRRVQAQTALLESQMRQRESLEATLRQAQRLESLGQLAGGVAHDFNNILVAITSYSHLLLRELAGQEKALGWAEQIKKAGERAATLTRQLLAVSRRQILRPVVVSLNALVSDLDEMLRRIVGEDIELTTRLSSEPLPVRVDPGQVGQVVMNLCVNARDAMPEGGRLTLETSSLTLDAQSAQERPGVTPGEYACLTVSDTGTGMDAQTRARIFEPFFTTKRAGMGTGLGLAIALGIVEQSGGHMGVASEPGQGTSFTIYFPRVSGQPERDRLQPKAPIDLSGRETVLVVEDDQVVQRLAIESLTAFGYTVTGATTGEQALALVAGRSTPLHLLVTDVVLPGMNGRKLADRLTAERPDLRVLFMSGYTHDIVAHRDVLRSGINFLPKPFGPTELGAAVRAALDRRQ